MKINKYLHSVMDRPYKWREHDCLSVIQGFLKCQGLEFPDYSEFYEFLDEKNAIAFSRMKYGGMIQAHIHFFDKIGIARVFSEFWQSGDIVLFSSIANLVHVAFASESCELFTFYKDGLEKVDHSKVNILGIYRCQR